MEQKERSINELLQLVLDNIDMLNRPWCGGLCIIGHQLFLTKIISYNEEIILYNYIHNNKPINIRTILGKLTYGNFNIYHFWKRYSKQPRINWLKKHIKKTDPNKPIVIKNFSFSI